MNRLFLTVALLSFARICAADQNLEQKKDAALAVHNERMQLLNSPNYDGYSECDVCWKNISTAWKADDFEKVIIEADKGIKIEPYSLRFLMQKSGALRKLGKIKESDEVRKQWFSIADSIFMTYTGKSKDSAIIVLRVNEEYSILELMGLERDKQSLVHDGDHIYDVLETTNSETGEKITLYFDITIIFNSLATKFGG